MQAEGEVDVGPGLLEHVAGLLDLSRAGLRNAEPARRAEFVRLLSEQQATDDGHPDQQSQEG